MPERVERQFVRGKRNSHLARPAAFTLVELLVVVGIIALLVSILLPALAKSIDSARTISCLSNLRQLAMANMAYVGDTAGYNVPGGYNYQANASTVTRRDTWAAILVYRKYLPETKPSPWQWNWAKMTGSAVLRCPAGTDFPISAGGTPNFNNFAYATVDGTGLLPHAEECWLPDNVNNNWRVQSWYSCNAVGSDNDSRPGTNATQYWPMTFYPPTISSTVQPNGKLPKYSDVTKPSETVMFYEGMVDGAFWSSNNTMQVIARHNQLKYSNVVFFDGHAETLPCAFRSGDNVFPMPTDYGTWFGYANNSATASTLNAKYPYPKWRLDQ